MQFSSPAGSLKSSYIREILSTASQPDMISMAGGLPASSLLPVDLIRTSCASLADHRELFQYGASRGYSPLIATLNKLYPEQNNPWLICNGSQQGLDLIARAFLNPGDGVVAEIPAYLGALQVFQLSVAQIYPLYHINENGESESQPDLIQLESHFKTGKVKLFYAVPDFHNPTGRVWAEDTRIRVSNLCRLYGVMLIEDSPYRELRFSGEQRSSLTALYPEGCISLKSFSKTGFPGVRLGAMSGPAEFIAIAERIKQATDLHTGLPQQALINALLNHPKYPDHLAHLRNSYKSRHQQLRSELIKQLGNQIQFERVEGGMFIWLKLTSASGTNVAARALEQKLAVVPGAAFYPEGVIAEDNAIRLNFSNTDPSLIPEAVSRLARSFCSLS
ncbi:MAG: PLP-dependent aminotransferase family protein [Amphritea sp.]|nr:PLP-dependent aminotransferase family protein [Amphritea sp.]MBQ0783000.1 PLP-dependent aminotransferase family protein [Amphritea sp.]